MEQATNHLGIFRKKNSNSLNHKNKKTNYLGIYKKKNKWQTIGVSIKKKNSVPTIETRKEKDSHHKKQINRKQLLHVCSPYNLLYLFPKPFWFSAYHIGKLYLGPIQLADPGSTWSTQSTPECPWSTSGCPDRLCFWSDPSKSQFPDLDPTSSAPADSGVTLI